MSASFSQGKTGAQASQLHRVDFTLLFDLGLDGQVYQSPDLLYLEESGSVLSSFDTYVGMCTTRLIKYAT